MKLHDGRIGGAIAGAMLIALPAIELLWMKSAPATAHLRRGKMHLGLPLEQLVKRRGMAFQFAFATEAKELMPEERDFAATASHRGLHLLAQSEDGLVKPVQVLRDVYGESLDVAPPRVRLLEGVQVKEPIMHLRVSMYTDFRDTVKNALRRRGATLLEEYVRSTYCVLRYEAPLADLLGFSAELNRLTAGTAKHWIALSHYAIVNTLIITQADHAVLTMLGGSHAELQRELARAVLVSSGAMPPDVVTMNSTVVYRDETADVRRAVTIVYPRDADPADGRISVLSPIGTALLGLSVGQSIQWDFPDGSRRRLRVDELVHQPERQLSAKT
jgi:regulator of nucleoside diphosphate kinase